MAQFAETFDTFDAIGAREDLQDKIFDISPTETPFISGIGRRGATQHYHEWQTDSLATATHNPAVEGDQFAGTAITATTRVGNYTQEQVKEITVTDRARATDMAGRADELSYQLAKAGKEMKRDMEVTATNEQGSVAGSSSVAGECAGAEAWISTNHNHATGSTAGFSGGTVADVTDGTPRAFTDTLLDDAIQDAWTQGGNPRMILVGAKNKVVASGFGGIATNFKNVNSGQATIVAAADLYVSDFGEHSIVPGRFNRDRTALILDMEMWEIATLQQMHTNPIAKIGTAERRQLVVDWTLVSKNEAASAKVPDLTTP